MPGRVTDYRTKRNSEYAPNELHGVKEVRMLLIQCTDHTRTPNVLIGIEVSPGDIRVFPEDTWNNLGRPSAWLNERLDEYLQTRKPRSKPPSSQKPVAVESDGVDVMA